MLYPTISQTLLLTPAAACSTLACDITSPYAFGVELAAVGVLLVIFVLAILYMVSPLLGMNRLRTWIHTKIYDEFAAMVFIFIFLAFGALVATLPVNAVLTNAGLNNSRCSSIINNPPPTSWTGATPSYDNLEFMSVCDVWVFNNYVNYFAESTFFVAAAVSLAPVVNWAIPSESSVTVPTGVVSDEGGNENPQASTGDEDLPDAINVGGFSNTNIGINLQFNLAPIQPVFHYFVPLLNSLYVFFVLSQVQLILLSASGLIYAVLMAVGLISRAFGITRTFGGAMIAFALGIGVVYPIMTVISYGFITHALDNASNDFYCDFSFGAAQTFGIGTSSCPSGGLFNTILDTISSFISGIFNSLVSGNFVSAAFDSTVIPAVIVPVMRAYIVFGGLVAIGLTFIPLLNLTVVDAFIVDFSQAVGERMDFLSLLTRLL